MPKTEWAINSKFLNTLMFTTEPKTTGDQMSELGKFIGKLKVEYRDGGTTVILLEDVTFIDSQKKSWTAKKGMISDGASIPRIAWSIIGSPLQGPYVRPAVIHDQYCFTRIEPYKMVHKMFHEAMLVDGVDPGKAKAMYLAVLCAGPRWDELTVEVCGKVFRQKTEKTSQKRVYVKARNPKSKTIRLGKPIDKELLNEMQRKGKAITLIDLTQPIKFQHASRVGNELIADYCYATEPQPEYRGYSELLPEYSNTTKTEISLLPYELTINVPQNTHDLTKEDINYIVEFANKNPSIENMEKFSDEFRQQRGLTQATDLDDVKRYMRQQKVHIINSNDQKYLLKNTPLSEKNLKRLVNSKTNIRSITNADLEIKVNLNMVKDITQHK